MKGKKRGSKKQRLQMWKKNTIQNVVEHKAHKNGIRISRICAWGTSKLCKFQNGKVYNCDLSASYNIGARYFIHCIEKSMSVKMWSDILAKVPECQKRTKCTYATLLRLNSIA